jgi:hypothetical protein
LLSQFYHIFNPRQTQKISKRSADLDIFMMADLSKKIPANQRNPMNRSRSTNFFLSPEHFFSFLSIQAFLPSQAPSQES